MTRYQACIGPGTMRVMHLRDEASTKDYLVMCRSTAIFYDFSGRLDERKICKKCFALFREQNPTVAAKTDLASLIGVAEIL